jgi:hypothetical protein
MRVVKRISVEMGTMSVSWYSTVRLLVLGSPATLWISAVHPEIHAAHVIAKAVVT